VDVEATAPVRQAEVGSVREMLVRTENSFGLHPDSLVADTAYGSGEMLGWLVDEQGLEPHIPVLDKTERLDGGFPATFTFDREANEYTWWQAAEEILARDAQAANRHLQGWRDPLLCQQARLLSLRAENRNASRTLSSARFIATSMRARGTMPGSWQRRTPMWHRAMPGRKLKCSSRT
jgi:hypothetical protein